jgi:hypothetical protein
MQVTTSMMRKEFITGMMDCDSAEMICGPPCPVPSATQIDRHTLFEATSGPRLVLEWGVWTEMVVDLDARTTLPQASLRGGEGRE